MNLGILTKLMGVTLRFVMFAPGLMSLYGAVADIWIGAYSFTPMIRFAHLSLLVVVFPVLCLMPYCDFLFGRKIKPYFLGLILVVCILKLRYEFLPFHYAAPELVNYPLAIDSFEEAKKMPFNSGFSSERRVQRKLLWLVRKPDFSLQSIVIMGSISVVPVFLFIIRSYEVNRGINWRNFALPIAKPAEKATLSGAS